MGMEKGCKILAASLSRMLDDGEIDRNTYYAIVNKIGEDFADEDEDFNFQQWHELTKLGD